MQTLQEQTLARLREEIESVVGRKMRTPKDFDFLAGQIFDKLHENVSSTTLKRIWGYLSGASPRISTLDLLAKYVDYADWNSFCRQNTQPSEPQSSELQPSESEPLESQKPHASKRKSTIVWASIALAAVAVLTLLLKYAPPHF